MNLAPAVQGTASSSQMPPVKVGSPLDINRTRNELYEFSRQLEKERQIEQLTDSLEQQTEVDREMKADLRRIEAPTVRAGYLVACIVGLLLFWFLTTVVFQGNRVATGMLIFATALFFLVMLKRTLEKRGARYIGETGGMAFGFS